MIDLTQESLTQCTQFFTQGDAINIIGGAATVLIVLITSLTKHNIPDAFKIFASALMKKKGK